MMGLKKENAESYEPEDLPSAIHLIERLKDKIQDNKRYQGVLVRRIEGLSDEAWCWKKLYELECKKFRRMTVDTSTET